MSRPPGPVARVILGGRAHEFDLEGGRPIGIPLGPGGAHPRFFIAEAAAFEPLETGRFSGRVNRGASCNAGWVRFAPHCHGTHTEGPGHLAADPDPVQAIAPAGLLAALLVSVDPVAPEASTETAPPGCAGGLIDSTQLPALDPLPALVVRTRPNPRSKCRRDYTADPAYPVFSTEAVERLVDAGVEHLLIDTPSLDPAGDGGALVNHRAFWRMAGGAPAAGRRGCTITEMIYVPDEIADGRFLVALGVSAIRGEASPSAPVLYPER